MGEEFNSPAIVDKKNSELISDLNEGLSFLATADYTNAEKILTKIIANHPKFLKARINLGNAKFKLEKTDEAIKEWLKVIEEDDSEYTCYFNIANAYCKQEKYDSAIEYWEKSLLYNPIHESTILNLATTYAKSKNTEKALFYYEKYLKHSKNKKSAEYTQIYRKIKSICGAAEQSINIGKAYEQKENYRNALTAYKQGIAIYPLFAESYTHIGNLCYKLHKFSHACKYWKKALKYDDSNIIVYHNLGMYYETEKDFLNAYSMYNIYLQEQRGSQQDSNNLKLKIFALRSKLTKSEDIINKIKKTAEKYVNEKKHTEALIEYKKLKLFVPAESKWEAEEKIAELQEKLDYEIKAKKNIYHLANKFYEEDNYLKAKEFFLIHNKCYPKDKFSKIVKDKLLECDNYVNNTWDMELSNEE